MRAGRSAWVVVAFVCATAHDAAAQFPFLPGEASGPDVRIAGDDPLADELARFVDDVEREYAEAEATLEGLEASARARSRRTDDEPGPDLLSLARQRSRQLAAALSSARRAREALLAPPPRSTAVGLARLVGLRRTAARLSASADQEARAAARATTAALALGGAPRTEVRVAEQAVRTARARAAEGRAIEARVLARRADHAADTAHGRLVLEPAAEKLARTELADRVTRLQRVEAESPPTPKLRRLSSRTSSVARARFAEERHALEALLVEQHNHQVRAAEAEVLARRALVWGHEALGEAPTPRPDELASKALTAQINALQDERSAKGATLERWRATTLPGTGSAWTDLRRRQIEALEGGVTSLLEAQLGIEEARATVDVVERVLREQHRLPLWQTALLIALSLLVGFAVMRYGGQMLTWLLAPEVGRLRLDEAKAARARAVVSLLWPLGITAATAAIIVWPVLGMQLTLLEALEVVKQPLFYVEDTAVSPLSIVQFVLTIWAAVVVSRWLRGFMTARVYTRTRWDIGLTNAFDTLVHYVILLVGLVLGLRFIGVGFSSLAILAGVLGIGIGFGLRNITENFISGLIILAERPIKIGDFIEVKDGEVEGRVESIQARSTTVITRDNISMIIPNSEFVARPVVNWSHGDPKVRVAVPVGVAYGSDTDLVRKVLLEVAGRHGQVLKKPAPEVQFRAFGGSSLDFVVLVWIEEQQVRFRIASDLHFAIDKAFRKRRIEIAFPQMDLHFKSVYPAVQAAFHAPPVPEPVDEGSKIPDRKSILAKSTTARPALGSGPSRPSGEGGA